MKKLKTQSGQAIVEAILIMVVFFGITSLVASQFKDNELIKNLVSGPWVAISSMISNGSWETNVLHPNYHDRHVTHTGIPAKTN